MTYLITGATGFIGVKLVDSLLRAGHTIHYLGRKPSDKLSGKAEFHQWTPGESSRLSGLPALDGVFNLAGEPVAQRWTPEIKKRIYDSRVEGTRSLVNSLHELRQKPPVLVSASAVGYYGDCGDSILTENQPAGDDFLAGVCAAWEQQAFAAREFGTRVVAVRISTVLGRDGGALEKLLPPFRLGLGGRFGNGKQWMSCIQVDDLVRLMLFAASTASVDGAMNGSCPQPVTNAQFTAALAHALHRPAFLPIPKAAMTLMMGEMAQFLFASLRVVPKKAEQSGFVFTYPQVETALQAIV